MRAFFAALSVLLLTGPAFAHDGMHVERAYARVAMENAPTAAVFMDLVNHGSAEDRLIAVQADVSERAELHTHVMSDEGLMQMLPVDEGFAFAAHETRALARGGDHVMLIGLTQPLAEGDQFTLTMTFSRSGKVVVVVPVRNTDGAGDQAHDAADHSGHNAPAPVSE